MTDQSASERARELARIEQARFYAKRMPAIYSYDLLEHAFLQAIRDTERRKDEEAKASVSALVTALRNANDLLRSAYQIATRCGEHVNWDAFIAHQTQGVRSRLSATDRRFWQ